jgi:hypothetical protein
MQGYVYVGIKEMVIRMGSWFPATIHHGHRKQQRPSSFSEEIHPPHGQPGGVEWWRGVICEGEAGGRIYTKGERMEKREAKGIGRLGNGYNGQYWRL